MKYAVHQVLSRGGRKLASEWYDTLPEAMRQWFWSTYDAVDPAVFTVCGDDMLDAYPFL